jgi:ATP-dependent helicase HrpB
MPNPLPIWQLHQDILAHLTLGNRLVLAAPTGSGKTTQIPQMLLDAGLADPAGGVPRKIVVLQPRRVAARSVAARVAWERQTRLGGEVGYQIRFDDQTELGTRICFVTEGILLRWLQTDRTLAQVGLVLFDEFHERNLLSDVALVLVKRLQGTVRPDLKLVVMSATLDTEPVAAYLDRHCPVLISEGRGFPVEVSYLSQRDERPVTEQAADAVEQIVRSRQPGDILVFMPGMSEINSTLNALRAARLGESLALIPLHGDLAPADQDRAFAPNPLRKVIVATNVAETSITIEGIRHVVDSGLARIARYDAERGIGTLFIEEISRASAEQRQGRAGRTAPGTCRRLWTESNHLNRPERHTPEIQRCDLAEAVLLLHSLGIRQAAQFDWLDKPDPQAVERAEELLGILGALDRQAEGSAGDLTDIGRRMLRLPMHPRYSRMLVEAAQHRCVPGAALCAALVSGRDLLVRLSRDDRQTAEAREVFEASAESDFFTLIRAFRFAQNNRFNLEACRRYGVHAQIARQVDQTYEQIRQISEREGLIQPADPTGDGPGGLPRGDRQYDPAAPAISAEAPSLEATLPPPASRTRVVSDDPLLRCIMVGFIDQLCVRRDQGTLDCELTEGRTGTLMRESVVQHSPLFVTASIREVTSRGSGNLTLLGLASAVKREWIESLFPQHVHTRIEHLFDRTHKRVAAVKLVRFRDLVIHHEHQREIDPPAAGLCLAESYRKGWFELPLFNHEIKQFVARVNLVAAVLPELEFPALDAAAVLRCLARALEGITLAKEAQAAPLREVFFNHLEPSQRDWLNEIAPLNIPWPDNRKLKLLYPEATGEPDGALRPPELQVKIQDCFPLQQHPRIAENHLPVRLWICSPDGKRLKSTDNWLEFKAKDYPVFKPALQKKFPGVAWP